MNNNEITLYKDQDKIIQDILQHIRAGEKTILVAAATGSGKTVVMAKICYGNVKRNRKTLIVLDMNVLVDQTVKALKLFGLSPEQHIGYIKADKPENRGALIQIASVQTMIRRDWWKCDVFDYILFDEAHQTTFSKEGKFIFEEYMLSVGKDKTKIIGFTATPYRLDKEDLNTYYKSYVCGSTPKALQDQGRLAKMKYFAPSEPERLGFKINKNTLEFDNSQLLFACNAPEFINQAIKEYKKHAMGKKAIAFCINIDHAQSVASAFNRAGISSDFITADTPEKEREDLFKSLKAGNLKLLANVGVISTGFDLPELEVGLLLRPTMSWGLHIQQVGRIMRTAEGKDHGIIIDLSGNISKHGIPETIDEYYLYKKTSKFFEKHYAKTKTCEDCKRVVHVSCRQCPECGHIFSGDKNTDLVDLISVDVANLMKKKIGSKEDYLLLRRFAYKHKYDLRWADIQFKRKYANPVLDEWKKGAIFGENFYGDAKRI